MRLRKVDCDTDAHTLKEYTVMVGATAKPKLKKWMTIRPKELRGGCVIPYHVLDELNFLNIRVLPEAGMAIQVLGRMEHPVHEQARIVRVLSKQLGFTDDCFYYVSDVLKRAQELGLKPCRPWAALVLRIVWKEQRSDEFVHIAHKPVIFPAISLDRKGFSADRGIFSLGREHVIGAEDNGQLYLQMKKEGETYLAGNSSLDHWILELP